MYLLRKFLLVTNVDEEMHSVFLNIRTDAVCSNTLFSNMKNLGNWKTCVKFFYYLSKFSSLIGIVPDTSTTGRLQLLNRLIRRTRRWSECVNQAICGSPRERRAFVTFNYVPSPRIRRNYRDTAALYLLLRSATCCIFRQMAVRESVH